MADHQIRDNEQGVYEIVIPAGETITIDVSFTAYYGRVQVMVHSGDKPVYIKRGTSVQAGDQQATMVAPMTWADMQLGSPDKRTIALTSESNAIVSVYRA